MRRNRMWVTILLATVLPTVASAVDLSVSAEQYATGGLFATPLIPGEDQEVTITVRATVEGPAPPSIPCRLTITAAGGEAWQQDLPLALHEGQASGEHKWTPADNGEYRVLAALDPGNEIDESDEANNDASIVLPVVLPGRKPHFPWFAARDYLRWPTIWAGSFDHAQIEQWVERGVMPLSWRWGNNYPSEFGEDDFYEHYVDFGGTPGIAVDECGYYPDTLSLHETERDSGIGQFVPCLRGMQRANKDNPDAFFLLWQAGTLYPEQAAMYRDACDLLVSIPIRGAIGSLNVAVAGALVLYHVARSRRAESSDGP